MDEEAILGGLRSGEDLPDYDYEDFEAGSTGQDRRGEDPGRDTPRSRGRYTDDGDDRIFRQATDDEQTRRVRSDRSGSESGHRHGQFDFISMAMNMARPHSDDPEAMPTRPRDLLFQVSLRYRMSLRTGRKDQGLWFWLREISRVDPLVLKIQVSLMSMRRGNSQASDTMIC